MTKTLFKVKAHRQPGKPIVLDGRLKWGNTEKRSFLFLFGGVGYGLIELIWRGRTHPSMIITGGICFVMLYGIGKALRRRSVLLRSAISCAAITAVEFSVGVIVNLILRLSVWDYSANRFNLLGQICLLYTFLWFLLSVPLMLFVTRLCAKIENS